jgi:hypothetical protein
MKVRIGDRETPPELPAQAVPAREGRPHRLALRFASMTWTSLVSRP